MTVAFIVRDDSKCGRGGHSGGGSASRASRCDRRAGRCGNRRNTSQCQAGRDVTLPPDRWLPAAGCRAGSG